MNATGMLRTRGNIDKISGEVTDGLGGFHPLKGKVPPPPPLLYSTRRSPLCWFNKGRQYQVRLQALTDADGIANSTSRTRCIRRSSPISKVRVLANQNKPKHTPGICEKSGRDDARRMVRFARGRRRVWSDQEVSRTLHTFRSLSDKLVAK